MNNMNIFQYFCVDKWFGPDNEIAIPALGIAGEAGEVADKIKKMLRGDKVYPNEIIQEVGDVLYYCAIICDRFDYTLSDAAKMEMNKIYGRIERGTQRGDGDNR